MSSDDRLQLDHVVVAATTLEQGVAWCRRTFGIEPAASGAHPLMGTHNRVFAIAGRRFPRAYFEIIAIDPQGPRPAHARWFDLDDPALQAALAVAPRLVHWVARCADVAAMVARLRADGIDPGTVVPAERPTPSGVLRWQITVRDDGRRLGEGAFPTLLQWGELHPTDALPACGVTLAAATIASARLGATAATLARLVEPDGVDLVGADPVDLVEAVAAPTGPAPPIRLVFETPCGPVILESLALEP